MSVEITESAAKKITDLCRSNGKIARLSISSGGCQGFNKVWELIDEIDQDDIVYDLENWKLVIDPASLEILGNARIDYKNDISGSYFSVEIPSATSTCGCGTSFSI